MSGVEQLTPAAAHHGEGPIWDVAAGCLRWVDMLRGDVLTLAAGDRIDRLHVGPVAAAIRPRATGGLVVAVQRGFALIDPDGAIVESPELWADPTVRMNEGACDPQGRFYCGSMAYDISPGRGTLYRLDPDRTATAVLTGVGISNGLAWRAGGTEALYVDTLTRRVDVLDFDAARGAFGERRPFVTIADESGYPDGIALDAEGGVWVALWEGAAVHRYDPDGELSAVVEVPVERVTACALDGGNLFITTSAVDDPGNPLAGAVFRAQVGVSAAPIGAFAG